MDKDKVLVDVIEYINRIKGSPAIFNYFESSFMVFKMKNIDHDGTRTHNLPIRSRTPYPLGHAAAGKLSLKANHIKTIIFVFRDTVWAEFWTLFGFGHVTDDSSVNHLTDALRIMNFSSEEIQNIIEVVAAMLLMGNLNFERDRATTGSSEKSKIQNRKILSSVARLLKIEESELEKSLTQRIVNAKGDSVKCTLNTDEAEQAQKSFVKVTNKNFSHFHGNFWKIFENFP